jgi:hypothetical protein
MKALTYRRPVDAAGNIAQWLLDLRNQSGAYVIRSRRGRSILYVGESHTGRLAKTIKRHFYRWRDTPERKHHTYRPGDIEIAVRLTPPGAAAVGSQDNLILRLEPRDNGTNPKATEADPF